MPVALEFENLRKEFRVGIMPRKRVVAVEGLNLSVNSGEIFGFLGPNGAGKTTCIKLCMGFIRPTSGAVTMLGRKTADRRVLQRVATCRRTRSSTRTSPADRPCTSSAASSRWATMTSTAGSANSRNCSASGLNSNCR